MQPVGTIVRLIARQWGGSAASSMSKGPHPKEAALLSLNCDKAMGLLHWNPCWHLETLVEHTVGWYKHWLENPAGLRGKTLAQIEAFEASMADRQIGVSAVA